MITLLSIRRFRLDPAEALRFAKSGPVVITSGDRVAFVLAAGEDLVDGEPDCGAPMRRLVTHDPARATRDGPAYGGGIARFARPEPLFPAPFPLANGGRL